MSMDTIIPVRGDNHIENFNLSEIIFNEYELNENLEFNRLYFNNTGWYNYFSEDPVITTDNVALIRHDEEGVIWSFTTETLGIGILGGTITSASKETKFKDKYKIRHEFVAEALQKCSTDVKLREIFKEENDEDDELTPDFIWKDRNNVYHVLELATTRNNTEDGLKRSYDTKAFKYKYALEVRALQNICITYSIIVVSQDMVLSSIRLPRQILTELIVRMRIGLALENLAKSQGISLETDVYDVIHKALVEELERNLSKIPYLINNKNDLTITQNYIDSIKGEPDGKEVLKIYLESINDVKRDIPKIKDNNSKLDDLLSEYIAKFETDNGKNNLKSPINLPLFLSEPTKSNVDIPDILLRARPNCLESKIWSIAMDNYRTERIRNVDEDPTMLMREALETNIENIKEYESSRKSQRSRYHRVNIMQDLNLQDKEKAAEQGLWAKKHKNDVFYKERRLQSQKPFSWNTYTDDISDFICNSNLLDYCDTRTDSHTMIEQLIEKSEKLIGNSSIGLSFLQLWSKTKLFRALDLISDIGMELCISNKQNCKSGFAILKKLRYHEAYILIFPTKSSEHTFFTLYFPKGECLSELPFRRYINVGDGFIYPLVSVKQSKLENWCNASSSVLSLASFWSWFYELNNDSPEHFKYHSEASKMLLLSLLIRLEDKAETEESVTQMRYMYMESFKGLVTPIMSNPFKILSKLTTRPKSRLNLWVIKNCLNNFKTMIINPPVRMPTKEVNLIEGEDSLPKDSWLYLLNCFTGSCINSASKIINLVYLGYLKNKNESPEGNTDFSLIEKTLEEEFKLDRINIRKSMGESNLNNKPGPKQFSKNCIMFGSKLMEDKLSKALGQNWKDQLGTQILDKLAEAMTSTIASLKASCSINHEFCPDKASLSDPQVAMRIKVIEALAKKIDNFGLNPFTKLEEFISYIEATSNGVISDLFKKQQHGGLREIYVLTIESRIVQLFIEIISRTICSYFDEETLTHPKNKLRKLNEHRRLSARLASKRSSLSVDLCSSNDKTRWNQNFVMSAMIIPLIRMTPEYLHNPIIRIMNLWTNKLIRIPPSVCNHLINRTKFSSSTFNKMANLFWNPSKACPIFDDQMSNCVRLNTGMMQGILHYTSSLLHLTFLHSSNKIMPTILRSWYPENGFIMSQICSSDDSATMLSIFSPTNHLILDNVFVKVCCMASLALESLSSICAYFCMQESVKTTSSLIDYVEFNSEFMFNNTIAMPVIKFVSASLNLTESESFLERFYTQYNLISDLFASGFTAHHTHFCQISQAYFHYKTMGSSTNALFKDWVEHILDWPDPKYGFFLLDLDLMPGVLGYSYAHWNVSVKTQIFQGTVKELNTEPWIVTPEGGITQSLIIKHGEVLRWKKLVKNVVKDMDIQDLIKEDPSILFRLPENVKELNLKLAIQSTSPGVAKSMRRGNPFLQSVAMSVYAINTHSFSKTTVTQEFNRRVKHYDKVCILGELTRLKVQEITYRDLENSLNLAFPNKKKFEELQNIISQMRKSVLVECHRFRERKNEIIIQPRTASLPLSLLQVLKMRWFGIPIRASHKIYKSCLNVYKESIPWLRDTIDDTLEISPFETYQELHGFINSTLEKTRVFRRNGPGLYSRRFLGQIYNLIRKSQRPCMILVEPAGKKKKLAISSDLITKINLALSIPIYHQRNSFVQSILKESSPLCDDLTSISNMTRREATLAYIQGVLKENFTVNDVAIHMRDMGLGTHISYVQEQRKIISDKEIKWIGEGKCYVFLEGCQALMTIKDEYLVQVKIDNWKRLKSNMFCFNQLIRDMKLKPIMDSSRPRLVLAKYNGTNFVAPNCVGCPVLQLEERSKIKFDPSGLSIKIDLNEIKIVQKVLSQDKARVLFEVCMLKYKMNHNDIILSQKNESLSSIWNAWINQHPCQDSTMFSLIKRVIKDKDSQLFRWMRDTLQSRLQFKNLGSFNIKFYDAAVEYEEARPVSLDEEDEEVEALLNMIKQGKMDIEESAFMGKIKPEISLTTKEWVETSKEDIEEEERIALNILMGIGIDDPLPLWVEYVKNWQEFAGEESVSIIGPAYGSFLSVHPLWDEVINNFYVETPSFWMDISDGKVPVNYELVAKDLMELLEIKTKPITERVTSILERYKLAKEYSEIEAKDDTSSEGLGPSESVFEVDVHEQFMEEIVRESPNNDNTSEEDDEIFEIFN
ncbi:putative RNA-dependent RNA polymerase complex [Linepithema humile bunya-like virus 1]|uniref:RNA-directed RNA polymerase L n=1 Tax=Linepithema humile bunyan-like virus 1 TaxID=2259778 RepID=A0A2Z4Z4B9_9VIRU|nr:putative RdRp-complex [Linepithema humile bunyan-like virus 1]UXD80034.1 putative RNA-dependent RNA polymerase complex [Linepithema humile bunya-like virus 1]